MEPVASGAANYAHVSTGNSWAYAAKEAAVTRGAGVISSVTVSPTRLSVGYEFASEDVALLGNLEDVLRRDMRMSFTAKVNDAVLNNATATDGFDGLLAELTAPAALQSGDAEETYASYLAKLAGYVDGKYAGSLMGLSVLFGSAGYAHFASRVATAGYADGATLASKLQGVRASGHMPGITSKGAVAIVRVGSDPGAVAIPVWDSMSLIRDPYTASAKAVVALTAHALWNMSVIRQAHLKQRIFKVQA